MGTPRTMTVGQLRKALDGVSDDLEIVVRASDDEIGDICCGLRCATVEASHSENEECFLALDAGDDE